MVTQSLPVQVLYGVYLGLLTGIIPGVVSWALAFLFRYVTGLTVPGFAVVGLGVAIAGVNGGFMAFNDPTIVRSANSVTLITALLVVMMLAFYTHGYGDRLGAAMPRRVSLRSLRDRTLNADVVELIGGRRQARVRVVGSVADIEGYPPLPAPLRESIAGTEHTFPADRSLAELETDLAAKLREEHDLEEVSVAVDEAARATVAAAPPTSGVSRRVARGDRAVSLSALLPTGVAPGDEVSVLAGEEAVEGTVLSVAAPPDEGQRPADGNGDGAQDGGPEPAADGGAAGTETPASPEPSVCPGGEGRVTVSVPRTAAPTLLGADRGAVLVTSRGTRREFELVALLRRAGGQIRRLSVGAESPIAAERLGGLGLREDYGVAVLAVRHGGEWAFAPRGETELAAGDELFAVGARDALDRFAEVVA
jgi:hypothetical protein